MQEVRIQIIRVELLDENNNVVGIEEIPSMVSSRALLKKLELKNPDLNWKIARITAERV